MKHAYLQRLHSLDGEAFGALMRHLGYPSAALYRLEGSQLVQLVSSMETGVSGDPWPTVAAYNIHYTQSGPSKVHSPWGWIKLADMPTDRNHWRKGTNFYFPEQEIFDVRLVFAVKPAQGKRCRAGELDGTLEAAAGRYRSFIAKTVSRAEISELGFQAHVKALGVDLQMLIDHELRTPLSSVSGYATLMQDLDPRSQEGDWREYSRVIHTQATYALEALEKLSLALPASDETNQRPVDLFDAAEAVREFCAQVKDHANDLVGAGAAVQTNVRFLRLTDHACLIEANPQTFRWAIWEVLKNAVIHSKAGDVEVQVYTADTMLVIDVADDGHGVSEGSEELIFLRFYQDPATRTSRKGKRGLGLGLFLARHLAERHMGQLSYIRKPSKGGTFRFLWPLARAEQDKVDLSRGA